METRAGPSYPCTNLCPKNPDCQTEIVITRVYYISISNGSTVYPNQDAHHLQTSQSTGGKNPDDNTCKQPQMNNDFSSLIELSFFKKDSSNETGVMKYSHLHKTSATPARATEFAGLWRLQSWPLWPRQKSVLVIRALRPSRRCLELRLPHAGAQSRQKPRRTYCKSVRERARLRTDEPWLQPTSTAQFRRKFTSKLR